MRNKGSFTFGNANSEAFDIIMTEPPTIAIAERETKTISVSGRSGDLVIDMGRYKNVPITYQCALIPKMSQNLRELAVSALELLNMAAGYQRLENSFQPGYYRMAKISGRISIESIVERAGRFSVEFDCKPQRFLWSGEYALSFEAAGTILNPTGFEALPIIKVSGTDAGEVYINGTTVRIDAITDPIILDCENQNAYSEVEGSVAVNQNGNIYAPQFPTLSPGNNSVAFTGGITKLEITPRWWTL